MKPRPGQVRDGMTVETEGSSKTSRCKMRPSRGNLRTVVTTQAGAVGDQTTDIEDIAVLGEN